jgi:hypothetical protein
MRHRQKTYDIVCDVVRQNGKNLYKSVTFLLLKCTISYVFWRYRTLYIRCRTKNVLCRIRQNIRYRIRYCTSKWQELVFWRTISYVRRTISYTISYTIYDENTLFCLHHNTSFSLQALFHPCLLKTAMTRIVHGIRMMKGIMLTSSLHLLARWSTAPDHGIPLLVVCPLCLTGVSWTKWLWTTQSGDCQCQS